MGGGEWVGNEIILAWSTCGLLRIGRQPTPPWSRTCFREGLPWNTLEEFGDSSVQHRQKHSPAPTHRELGSGHGASLLRPES